MSLDEKIQSYKEEMIETIKDVLSYESVSVAGEDKENPYGKEVHDCLRYMLKKGEEFGFSTYDMNGQVGWCEYGSGEEMVVVLCHLDVVPAGDGWIYPPYAGTVVGDKIFGRGAIDDKGPAVTALYALKAIKESGINLNKRIRVMFGCDEECGFHDVQYYLANGGEVPVSGFSPDADYPLVNGEKGFVTEKYRCEVEPGIIKNMTGGSVVNMVPCSASVEFCNGEKQTFEGISTHGSRPWDGENAIGKMLIELNKQQYPEKLKNAIEFLATKIGMECEGESLGIKLCDDISGRLSFNLGTIDSDGKSIEVGLNYRYPVSYNNEDCVPKVQKQFLDAGFELIESIDSGKVYVPEDHFLVKTLMSIYNEYTQTESKPMSIGGGTYAKVMPNILAFGATFPDDEITCHRANEYIKISRLMTVTQINATAMVELAK